MKHVLSIVLSLCALSSATFAQDSTADKNAGAHWPQWRGPFGTGAALHAKPVTQWSETENVRWKVDLPGTGHATPIVWGDRIYVQTAIDTGRKVAGTTVTQPPRRRGRGGPPQKKAPTSVYRFALLALDRNTGATIWDKTLCEAVPHEGTHPDGTQVSNSPVTDGEQIYAYFGSRGLYCLDLAGEIVWQADFGEMKTRHSFGEGSSPALHENTLVITWDHEGRDFIVALDKRTGKELWRTPREEPTSWATPVVVVADGKAQVVASAAEAIRSYDLKTGELLWSCTGMTGNVIPTPVCDQRYAYCTSGYRGTALLAIRYPGAHGDLTGTPAVAWNYDGKGTPYVPSPLLYDGCLYFVDTNKAMLSCVDADTGEAHYARQRIEGLRDVYASLVAADGHVYVVGRDGKTAVVKAGKEYELLGVNTLDDGFDASPVIAGGALYLRGRENLYCIGSK